MPTNPVVACVDYNTAALSELKRKLETAGYTVLAAGTLSYALAAVSGVVLDAVLLNDQLPGRDAREIVTRLKQANGRAHIIAFSTGACASDC